VGEEVTQEARCSSCGARLIWAQHSKTKKPAPITADPKDNGNVLVFRSWPEGEPTYTLLSPTLAGLLRKAEVPLRLNHFADCPYAETHKPEAGV